MRHSVNLPPFGSSDLHSALNVVIVYEDFETGKQAKRTYDFLVENIGAECQFNNQMWKFEVLSIPKLREMAANDAAQADIVVVSCHGADLPNEVRSWIELWLAQKSHPIALVALFDGQHQPTEQVRHVRAYLANVAKRGQMEFFAQPDEPPALAKA